MAALFLEIDDKRVSDFHVRFLSSGFQSRSFMVVILMGLDLFWRRIGVDKSLVSWMRLFFT